MQVKVFPVPLIDALHICAHTHSDGDIHGWIHPVEAKWAAAHGPGFHFALGPSRWLPPLAQALCLLGIPTSLASLDSGTESCLNANDFLGGRDIIIH